VKKKRKKKKKKQKKEKQCRPGGKMRNTEERNLRRDLWELHPKKIGDV